MSASVCRANGPTSDSRSFAGRAIHILHFGVQGFSRQSLDALDQSRKDGQTFRRVDQHFVGEFDRPAVVRAQEHVSQNLRPIRAEQFRCGDDVPHAPAHLFLRPLAAGQFGFDAGQAVVQPVFRQRLAVGRFGLGQLIFMMGEHEVHAAAVDIEGFAEVFLAHRRAFDMPAGPPLPPG